MIIENSYPVTIDTRSDDRLKCGTCEFLRYLDFLIPDYFRCVLFHEKLSHPLHDRPFVCLRCPQCLDVYERGE